MSLSEEELKWRNRLTEDQYRVCRQKATEAPYTGEYNQQWGKGVYKCVCCDQPLFGSDNKFESGCGWPSFDAPLETASLAIHEDTSLGILRQEVVCSRCGAHQGHVFDDGPTATGLRYCINSVALKFKAK